MRQHQHSGADDRARGGAGAGRRPAGPDGLPLTTPSGHSPGYRARSVGHTDVDRRPLMSRLSVNALSPRSANRHSRSRTRAFLGHVTGTECEPGAQLTKLMSPSTRPAAPGSTLRSRPRRRRRARCSGERAHHPQAAGPVQVRPGMRHLTRSTAIPGRLRRAGQVRRSNRCRARCGCRHRRRAAAAAEQRNSGAAWLVRLRPSASAHIRDEMAEPPAFHEKSSTSLAHGAVADRSPCDRQRRRRRPTAARFCSSSTMGRSHASRIDTPGDHRTREIGASCCRLGQLRVDVAQLIAEHCRVREMDIDTAEPVRERAARRRGAGAATRRIEFGPRPRPVDHCATRGIWSRRNALARARLPVTFPFGTSWPERDRSGSVRRCARPH